MRKVLSVVLLTFLAISGLAQKHSGRKHHQPPPPPPPVNGWQIDPQNSPATSIIAVPGAIAAFNFPSNEQLVGYVVTNQPGTLKLTGTTLSMSFNIVALSGTPVFGCPTDDCVPGAGPGALPKISLHFCSGSDPYNQNETETWWSKEFYDLALVQGGVLSVALDPADWTGLFGNAGSADPAAWQQAWNSVVAGNGWIGFTMGGEFAGHGVFDSNGQAQLQVTQYEAN